jgi:hypothetical protein
MAAGLAATGPTVQFLQIADAFAIKIKNFG